MTREVRNRPEIAQDLLEAAQWYESQSQGLGVALVQAMDDVVRLMVNFPEMYPVASGSIRRAVLSTYPYNLYYKIGPESVTLLALLHQSRAPAWIARRLKARI
ncbi:MAG: type II toxin-antitoxin system RelE/ParE family toxin [Betaproteobacteria bacterium]|nr:type II toxin-antitoxin system RelE/ParE family toxin [Betaproteobacteria bacterium]